MNAHLISVDLEDWFTSGHLRNFVKPEQCISRIEATTYPILKMFEEHNIQATFFCLGSVASEKPGLIKDIVRGGHELASHTWSHTPLWHLTPNEFRKEIRDTNKVLEDISGKKVIGYRAPYASLNEQTAWAIDILLEEGFLYDSSIFPMKTPRYGVTNAPFDLYRISSDNIKNPQSDGKLIEIPFTVYKKYGLRIPCTGGIYGRYLPYWLLSNLLLNISQHRPLNFYFHPWETDPDIPIIDAPLYNKMVAYYNVSGYLDKIKSLLQMFEFTSFKTFLTQKGMLELSNKMF